MGNTEGFPKRLFQARNAYSARQGRTVPQTELAPMVGVTPAAWSAWELGRTEPGFANVAKIAKLLGVDPGWLAFGTPARPDVPDEPLRQRDRLTAPDGSDELPTSTRKRRGA